MSLGEVLLTGVPKSILAMALTNVPAVSRLLWSEFLDDNTPTWFTALPTDIQAYLSGEFGPTTAVSNSASSTRSTSTSSSSSTPSPSPTNTPASAVADTQDNHSSGLPLWAKILIGVLVPLLVLGLLGLLLLCCLRRRRHRRKMANARSRTPTPAFISTTYRGGRANPPGEQHVPLRGGHRSRDSEVNDEFVGSTPHTSSSSDEYRTPIGGPSYENIPPPPTTTTQNLRRSSKHSSRHSSTSLHSVPEMPEPMHGAAAIPLPPRSSQRNRDFDQAGDFGDGHSPTNNELVSPLHPSYSNDDPYHNQGIYAGGHNPYPNSQYASKGRMRPYSDPFSDPTSPHNAGYVRNSLPPRRASRDPELFLGDHDTAPENDANWPLRASEERQFRNPARTKSYDRYYEKAPVYEM